MKYTYNKVTYIIPDNEVDKLMDSLDISLAEACEMWLCDNDKIKDAKQEELNETAKKNRITATIHSAKGEKKERKPREKKVNERKKEIIQALFSGIVANIATDSKVIIRNDEKYIDFVLDGFEYTVNLVEHRPKKK